MKHFSLLSSRIANVARTTLFVLLLFVGLQARAQITVTASAGTLGPTVYATLNAAISAVNAGTHQGDILFTVTANTTETLLSTLVQTGSGAANYSTLTVKPAAATNPVISGNIATGILFILGSNVTIDGSNTVGGTTQNLTIRNTSGVSSYVVRIGSPSTSLGATNNQITNCIITNGNAVGSTCCVMVGSGTTFGSFAEAANSKTVIQNNTLTGSYFGIYYLGCVSDPDYEVAVTSNSISAVGQIGMFMSFVQSSNINNNSIGNMTENLGGSMQGLYFNGTMVNTNIYNNTIFAIRNIAAFGVYGIYLSGFNGPCNVYNNFIYGISSAGSGTVANNGEGIYIDQGSGYNIYHNTVNLTTNPTAGTGAPAAIMITAGITSPGAINLQNNIFANNQTIGTQRYAIYSGAAASVFASIDNNDYYTTGPNLGFLGINRATLAAIQAGFGSNTHSIVSSPPFVSATDLHINIVACSGTPLESGGAAVGIPTDIDGQVRPGPLPSTCGGGTAPDIGADEFDGGINDLTPPAITYTALPNICTPADVTLSGVTITDATGVPTSGSLMPRVYFRKNAGAWFSAPGTLTSGTTISGTWSFSIPMATMGGLTFGDVVSYYVIAEDNFGNITANPSTGLVATDVNTVTTPPTVPNTYAVGVSLSGVYHVGLSGTYTTLTAAVNAYNTACLLGPVTFLLDDATYPSETFPITVKYNSYASAVNTLTIKPSGTTTITGSLAGGSGLFFFYGSKYVTIDGSNSGTSSQNLTWSNTSGVSGGYVMRLGNQSPTISATNNTIKNCIITAGTTTIQSFGIISGSGTAFLGVAETPLVSNTIQNNNISNAEYGLYLDGFSTTADSNWTVASNTVSAGRWAMALYYMQASNIAGNTITVTSNLTTLAAILMNGAFYNTNVYDNKINGVTNTGANGAYGMYLVANNGSSGINIFNNFISGCAGTGSGTLANNGYGMYVAFGTGYNIVENSINMNSNQTTGTSAALCITNAVTLPGAINVLDNILANNQTAGVPVGTRYSIYSGSANTIFGTINYNDYYTTGTNLGFLTVNRTNIAAIQAGFGGNLNSINLSPTFVSPTDLHLQILPANAGLNAGLFVGGIVTDIDGDGRVTPTIGADELILCPLPITGTPTVCVSATTNLTDATTGGVWSSVPGTGNATVSGTGVVTGTAAGTVTISYAIGTCGVAKVVTVNPLPIPGTITGSLTVCPTTTTALSDATGDPGGVWSSVSPGIATVSGTGLVTGVTAGTSTISYTVTNSCGALAATAVVTVNPSPSAGAITGTLTVCATFTTLLSDATGTAGGVWSSVSPGIATVSGTGLVTGVAGGTSTISYTVTNSCGTAAATAAVTVNPLPNAGAITGGLVVCPTANITLADATGDAGGVWSSVSPGIATISVTGVVTGVANGTTTISYTVTNSCGVAAATAVVTVSATPNAGIISGVFTVCPTSTTNLTDGAGAGIWSSVSPGIATVSGTGVVTGVAAGTSTISYTVTNSCGTAAATAVVTVNPLPFAGTITGILSVCPTGTTNLTDAAGGGTWSSVSGGFASISGTGVVTGIAAGTSTISYTVTNSCGTAAATVVVTVNPSPNAGSITGGLIVCPTTTTNLTDAAAGGTWSSVSPGIATVSGTGVVTGVAAGTSTISYTVTNSCGTAAATVIVTVNPAPIPGTITGVPIVCPTGTTNLTDPAVGGTWSSVSPGFATVSGTGLVTGVATGTTTISYTVTNSCGTVAATVVVTVNPAPNAGAITGALTVCPASTTALTDLTGSAGGVWSSVSPGVATVSGTGLVTGVTNGTSTISYTVTNSCGVAAATAVVTVNPSPSAGTITGTPVVCPTATTSLSDAVGGGVWSSVTPGIATISGTGLVTGVATGTTIISYTVTNSCGTTAATVIVTVSPLPNAGSISGTLVVCPTTTTLLSDATGGGVWSSVSPGTATVSGIGLVTGVAAGTSIISYAVTNSCGTAAATVVVTVNPAPNAGSITGVLSVCPAATTALTDAAGGGIWSSVSPANATVSATGLVTGVATGTSTISYTVTNSCGTVAATAVVTVNVAPVAGSITGTLSVCPLATTPLTDAAAGGTWSSVSPGVATVSGTGLVTGVAAGTSTISYTVTNGCGTIAATVIVTVIALPNAGTIAGTFTVCPTTSTVLTDASGGGVWSSGDPAVAGVDVVGDVTGNSAGTAVISYAVTNSCATAFTTAIVTVNPSPFAGIITGTAIVCVGDSILLHETVAGGTWSSSATGVATIGPAGMLTGVSLGTSTIIYQVTNMCGSAFATRVASVNPAPFAGTIVGSLLVCPGTSVTLSDPASGGGGSWSTATPTIATIGSTSGIVTGVDTGYASITYTLTNSCGTATTTATVRVHPLPKPIMGGNTLCQENSIILSDSVADGAWSSSNTAIATVLPAAGLFPEGIVSGISVGTVLISYVIAPGCFVTETVTVNPLGSITLPSAMCVGSLETATDFPGGGTWSSSTPSVITIGGTSGLASAIASGAAIITYDLGPGCMVSKAVTVNILPPNFYVTGGGTFCIGTPGGDIGLDGSDTGVVYQLVLGSSVVATDTGTGAPIDFGTYSVSGVYSVRATSVSTGCGQNMGGTATIIMSTPTPPFVSINANPGTLVCVGSTVLFTALPTAGGTAPTYNWYVNSTSVGSGSTYSYIPVAGDSVSVTLVSNASCVSPDTATNFVIMNTTTGLMPSLTLMASPGDSVCPGTIVTITPLPVNGGTAPVYTWVKNGVDEGGGLNFVFVPTEGDNILCWMHSSLSCSLSDSVHSDNNILMNVPPINVPAINIVAIPGARISFGETDTLVAAVSFVSSNLSYQWAINGSAVPGATSDTFISSSFNNRDSVTCDVTGYSTCGSAVREAYVIIVDTLILGVRNVQAASGNLGLIPNPNNGTFTLKGTTGKLEEQLDITITDMLGQVIYQQLVTSRNGKIDEQIKLSQTLANGMYLLNAKGDGENRVFHFVIEK